VHLVGWLNEEAHSMISIRNEASGSDLLYNCRPCTLDVSGCQGDKFNEAYEPASAVESKREQVSASRRSCLGAGVDIAWTGHIEEKPRSCAIR
jgi:hypothetical protein